MFAGLFAQVRRPTAGTVAVVAMAAILVPCSSAADTAERLDRLASALERFVCEIPAPDADHTSALEMLDSLDVDPSRTWRDGPIHPSNRRLASDIPADALLLHRLGYHLHYALLPEPIRRYYWHPNRPDADGTSADPSGVYNRFAREGAGLFVACFCAYCRVRGYEIRGGGEARMLPEHHSWPTGSSRLVSAYGQSVQHKPTQVYGDFLQATIAYRRRCPVLNLPARTMHQWRLSRQMYGGLPGAGITVGPIAEVVPPVDHLLPLQPGGGLDADIDGEAARTEAVALSGDNRIKIGERAALIQLDQGHAGVVVGPYSRLIMRAERGLEIVAGQVLASGPVVLTGDSWTVRTTGGATALHVNAAGELTVGAVREGATVVHNAGDSFVPVGQVMTIPAAGPALGPGPASPMEVVYTLPEFAPAQKQTPLAALPDPPAQPAPTDETQDESEAGQQVAADPGDWTIFTPELLPEVVLCHGIGPDNRPEGISKVFAADAGLIVLFVRFDFGGKKRVLDIEWTREGRALTGRSIRAKGKRKFANNLRARANRKFVPGQYEVKLAIDGEAAAALAFTIE